MAGLSKRGTLSFLGKVIVVVIFLVAIIMFILWVVKPQMLNVWEKILDIFYQVF